MSKKSCKKVGEHRLGWGVLESMDAPDKILKRNCWFGGKDSNVLIKKLTLPNADIVAEGAEKCAKQNRDYFWVWELYATDIYRRPSKADAKSPYFFSYAFHHDGIVMGTFAGDGKDPAVSKFHKSFENVNNAHHWNRKFHPFIQNQWVYSTSCESTGAPLPPTTWASNQFRLTTDDAGIGILCTKGKLYMGVHFYSTNTGENHNDFGLRLFFRLRKMHADQNEILKKIIDEQMGRTPQNKDLHHYGDTGISILLEEDEANETSFWDNSIMDTELKKTNNVAKNDAKEEEVIAPPMVVEPPAEHMII